MPAAMILGISFSSGGYLELAEASRLQRPNVSSRAPLPLKYQHLHDFSSTDVSLRPWCASEECGVRPPCLS